MTIPSKILATALIAAIAPLFTGAASAAPVSGSPALKNSAAAPVEAVQWRRGWRGDGWSGGRWIGPATGFAAGAIIGGALATRPWDWGYGGYAYDPGYYAYPAYPGYDRSYYGYEEPYVEVTPSAPTIGDPDAYCAQRFRSYDPASGTYLGYDGIRHPCP